MPRFPTRNTALLKGSLRDHGGEESPLIMHYVFWGGVALGPL